MVYFKCRQGQQKQINNKGEIKMLITLIFNILCSLFGIHYNPVLPPVIPTNSSIMAKASIDNNSIESLLVTKTKKGKTTKTKKEKIAKVKVVKVKAIKVKKEKVVKVSVPKLPKLKSSQPLKITLPKTVTTPRTNSSYNPKDATMSLMSKIDYILY